MQGTVVDNHNCVICGDFYDVRWDCHGQINGMQPSCLKPAGRQMDLTQFGGKDETTSIKPESETR
jgi:hypothetical protein